MAGFLRGGKSNSISVARLEWKFSASYQIRNVTVCCLLFVLFLFVSFRHPSWRYRDHTEYSERETSHECWSKYRTEEKNFRWRQLMAKQRKNGRGYFILEWDSWKSRYTINSRKWTTMKIPRIRLEAYSVLTTKMNRCQWTADDDNKAETEWSIEWVWDTQRRNNYRGKGKPLIWTALLKTFFAFHLISLRYFCFVKSPHVAKNLKEKPNKNESPAYLNDVRSCLAASAHTRKNGWETERDPADFQRVITQMQKACTQHRQKQQQQLRESRS